MKNIVFDFYRVIYTPENNSLDLNVLSIVSSLNEKGIPLYLFTNTRKELIERLDKKNNFLKYFKNTIFNSESPKPDIKSFEKLIEVIGSSSSDLILVDDDPINISVANEFGIIGVGYTNSEDLNIKLNKILEDDK